MPRRWHKDAPEHRARGDVRCLLPAAQRPHRAEFGGAIGDGDGDAAASAIALRARQGQAQAALARLDVLDPDRRQFGAAQRAGEADQQQGAVAQPCEVVGHACQDLAQDVGGGGELLGRQLAGIGGGAMNAGQGGRDVGFRGGHRQAGDEVQVADGGAAQFDGVDGQATSALGGEEGDDVGGVGQAGQLVAGAPGAPGAHAGAVGAPGVVSFGTAGVGVGRQPRGADRAVMHGDRGFGRAVEPVADGARRRVGRNSGRKCTLNHVCMTIPVIGHTGGKKVLTAREGRVPWSGESAGIAEEIVAVLRSCDSPNAVASDANFVPWIMRLPVRIARPLPGRRAAHGPLESGLGRNGYAEATRVKAG